MKYSRRLKESALRKILPPENRSVTDVAREMGISDQTIYNWKRQAENGTLVLDESSSPLDTGQLERYNLLLKFLTVSFSCYHNAILLKHVFFVITVLGVQTSLSTARSIFGTPWIRSLSSASSKMPRMV